MSEISIQFWGKAQPDADCSTVPTHPVAFHGLDVAAVGYVWTRRAGTYTSLGLHLTDGDVASLPSAVAFLLALHDVGKFSRPFQAKAPAHWPPCLGPFSAEIPKDKGHDTVGFALLSDQDLLDFQPLIGLPSRKLLPLLRAVTGHHGRPPCEGEDFARPRVACVTCRQALVDYVMAAHTVLAPPMLPPIPERAQQRLSWWLAGLAVLADWIGSSQRWFPYTAPDAMPLDAYWHERALPSARRALDEAGVLRAPVAVRGFDPLGANRQPTPVQALARTMPLPLGPALVVVEDATGAGKTEAAVILAHRLMAKGHADGVFVALPTMATADAMFGRVAAIYRALFVAEASPSLALAHGRAGENALFQGTILPWTPTEGRPPTTDDDPAGPDATAQCAAWLASDRRRTFLADVGVGTIDQALLAVLPARHAPLRLLGLCRKVLVVDEAHAYDPYMQRALERLLVFQAALGGSAVVLSATLPQAKRMAMVTAFRRGLGATPASLCEAAFPLITVAGGEEIDEHPSAMRDGLARTITVERVASTDAIVAKLVAAARSGACVAWVRNTVDDAIAAAALLQAAGVETVLFHARFALCDRLTIQDRVLAAFGHPDDPHVNTRDRAGKVVVATQVIEQSLDLDFDLLASDLAPVDLLIQRAGRLWRHDRGPRCAEVERPRLLVLSPEPVDDPSADWAAGPLGGTRFVYDDTYMLWRSARVLFAAGAIRAPDGLRELMEAVYPVKLPDPPPGLAAAANEAEGRRRAAEQAGDYALLEPGSGYRRDAGAWESDERTPTRLGEFGRVFRLARREGNRLVPYAIHAEPDRAWALSEITLPARFASEAPATSEVIALRAGWSRWERDIPVLILREDRDGWSTQALRGERTIRLCYHVASGLTRA